jgi:N-acetylglucosaminyldiphosphoundecaprenol N-acetyl-beta-D-mannosaminyltransferase
VHALNPTSALERIEAAIDGGHRGYVCLSGVHGVVEAQRDDELRRILNRAFLNLPDGMPTVWVGRAQGHGAMERVFGPDLMLAVCGHGVARGWRHFFYGGAPGVAPELIEGLCQSFPGIEIAGYFTPPFRPLHAEEVEDLRAQVTRARPDALWVGISTPMQERFMSGIGRTLDTTLLFGVGAAFDYHTGRLRDAPHWVKRAGLQWAHRLAQEPRRLARRYAASNSRFLLGMSLQALGLRQIPLDAPEEWKGL